jgi:putative membrane protein
MIKGTQAIVSASLLSLCALHCGGSTSSSKTPDQSRVNSPSTESSSSNGSSAMSTPQQSERVPTAGTAESNSTDQWGAIAQQAQKAIPLSDAQVASVTNAVNEAEIQQAQLAQKKSSSPQVLDYAKMMISDHTQAKNEQAGLGLGTASSALTKTLSTQGRQTMSELKSATGSDFDRKYLQSQIDGHQRVLDLISKDLLPNAKTPALQQQLEGMQSTVQRHLQAARDAMSSL